MEIKTLYGVFKDFEFTDYTAGEIFPCMTYKSVRDKIEGKPGFFNFRYVEESDAWVIFQYILDEDPGIQKNV